MKTVKLEYWTNHGDGNEIYVNGDMVCNEYSVSDQWDTIKSVLEVLKIPYETETIECEFDESDSYLVPVS